MRFVAALNTWIYGVYYLQGAEVDTSWWTRKMLLQFLGNGIIQASYITAGAITDQLEFVGDGVTTEVDDDGKVVVTIDPPTPAAPDFADLNDVDFTGLSDGHVPVYDATSGLWKPETPSGGGGGSNVLLLANGASVPGGTAAGTLVFEKAVPATTWDFTAGSLPSGWVKQGTPTESFSGAGMACTCTTGQGYYVPGLTLLTNFVLELWVVTQTSVSSIMFGPRIHDNTGAGASAFWYSAPSAFLTGSIAGHTYSGSFTQIGNGPPTYPTRMRIRKSGGSYYSQFSADSGVNWSPETPAVASAATPTRIGFGSQTGTANATVARVILRPGFTGGLSGRAKGWWDGTTLQDLT